MTWSTISKVLKSGPMTSHPHSDPKVVGRTPTGATLSFTPSELFGAAARSSHLHTVNIAIASWESVVMARLIEQYVDDVSPDFAILSKADTLKDYVKSYFAGTVAAGLAYLFMDREGYVWSDHFENVGGGNPKHGRKPDFVFAGPATGLALMESKGSRSSTIGRFDSTVLDGYEGQVEPHLGHTVGGQTAVRGYSVGSWMKPVTGASLRVHHTAPPPPASRTLTPASVVPVSGQDENLVQIQKHNFATAFGLAHSPLLAQAIRGSDPESVRVEYVPFLRFRWLGSYWVTGAMVPPAAWGEVANLPFTTLIAKDDWPWMQAFSQSHLFAIRQDVAELAMRSFMDEGAESDSRSIPFEVMSEGLRNRARVSDQEGRGGAVFADGLAMVRLESGVTELDLAVWRRGDDKFI